MSETSSFTEIIKSIWEIDAVRITATVIIQMLLTVLFSGFIGYEREHSHRPAGFRTHILVAVGSTLIMSTSFFLTEVYPEMKIDVTRMAAQVVSGIGFLGAGTIIRDGFNVKGLTTAASLWAVSCIGLAIGARFYIGAFIATIVIYLTLNVLKKITDKDTGKKHIYISVNELNDSSLFVQTMIKKCGIELISLEILYTKEKQRLLNTDGGVMRATIYSSNQKDVDLLLELLRSSADINDVYID